MTSHAGQTRAAQVMSRLVLCVALVLHLAAFPACRAAPAGAAPPELAALGTLLGRQVVPCHAGHADGRGNPPADHHCCDCGLCVAATILSPRPDDFGRITRLEAGIEHTLRRPLPPVARGPGVVATSPRGPPVLV